jgi:DNA polymerase (family 10)
MNQDNTERLVKACENPFVHAIGHPTGRLLGSREGYPVNMEKLVKAAKATGTALEINGQPERMDLNDNLARIAREQGVMLTLGTDSHHFGNFEFMRLGVAIARRAWCTAEDILNTRSWKEIQKFFSKKRKLLKAEVL